MDSTACDVINRTLGDDPVGCCIELLRLGNCGLCGMQTHEFVPGDVPSEGCVPKGATLTLEGLVLRGRCLLCLPIPSKPLSSNKKDIQSKFMAARIKSGLCRTCGIQTRDGKAPLTIEGEVLHGRCLLCRPKDTRNLWAEANDSKDRVKRESGENIPSNKEGNQKRRCCDPFRESPKEYDSKYTTTQISQASDVVTSTLSHKNNGYFTQDKSTEKNSFPSTESTSSLDCMLFQDIALDNEGGASKTHPNDEEIQARALLVMQKIAHNNKDVVLAVIKSGAVSTIVLAMRNSLVESQVACCALQNLHVHDISRVQFVQAGGLQALINIMKGKLGFDEKIYACSVLIKLAHVDYLVEEVLEPALQVGAVDCLVNLMQNGPDSSRLVVTVLSALFELVFDKESAKNVVDAAHWNTVASMRRHRDCAAVQDVGCTLLGSLYDVCEDKTCSSVQAIFEALETHPDCEKVQEYGLWALLRYFECPNNVQIFLSTDGVKSIIRQAIRKFPFSQCSSYAQTLRLKIMNSTTQEEILDSGELEKGSHDSQ